jgi:hypothetical protein
MLLNDKKKLRETAKSMLLSGRNLEDVSKETGLPVLNLMYVELGVLGNFVPEVESVIGLQA